MEHEQHDTMSASERERAKPVHSERRMLITGCACDTMMAGEKKQEGSMIMEQKVYKLMRGAGAANIAVGVIHLVVGLVTGILLIVAGAKLIAGKSKILF